MSEVRSAFIARLARALALDHPYAERFSSGSEKRHAAVLAVFAFAHDGEPTVLLTQRTDSVESHKGQIAFPGGRCEADELARADFVTTALRETEEEVGIPRADVEVIGKLPAIGIPTGFMVEPFVALHRKPMEAIQLFTSPGEIAATMWIPWARLAHPDTYKREMITRGAIRFPTHVFYYGEYRIWGATGAMLKNLLDRWEEVG